MQEQKEVKKSQNHQSEKKEQVIKKLKALIESSQFEKLDSREKNRQVFAIFTEERKAYKSKIKSSYTPQKILDYLKKEQIRITIDKTGLVQRKQIIKSNQFTVEALKYELAWPLPSMFFMIEVYENKSDHQVILAWRSKQNVNSFNVENKKSSIEIAGFVITQVSPTQSEVTFGIQADLGVGASQMLIRYFLHTQVQQLFELQGAIKFLFNTSKESTSSQTKKESMQ